MKKLIIILLLLFSGNAGASDLDNLVKEAESQARWNVNCKDDNCFMQVAVRYNKGPTSAMEQVGLAVSYNLKNKNVNYIGFFLPAGVVTENGLMIRFLNSVLDGKTYKLIPSQDDFIDLPINDCNKEYCASRVHAEIQSKDNSKINLLDELMSREHVWLLFMRNGNAERAMIPIYKFRDEFSKINEKNESNIGVQGTSQEPLRP
jgi:hypothetical protein